MLEMEENPQFEKPDGESQFGDESIEHISLSWSDSSAKDQEEKERKKQQLEDISLSWVSADSRLFLQSSPFDFTLFSPRNS